MAYRDISNRSQDEFLGGDVLLVASSEPSAKATAGERSVVPIEAPIGEDVGLVGGRMRTRVMINHRWPIDSACNLVGDSVGSSSWEPSKSAEQVEAFTSHGSVELEQPISAIRNMFFLNRPEEV